MTASERSPGEGEDVAWSDEVEHLIAAADVEAPLGAQIAEWLTAEPAGRVADIGCGPGAMTLALLARSPDAQVDAVDGEPMMLDAARRCLTAAGLDAQVEFRLGDLDSLELAEAAYDLVWVGSVVHHLPDQQSGVDRLAALLRPGGRLALGEGGLPLRLPALRSRHRSSRPGGQALGGAGGVVQRTARRHAGGRPRARGLDDPAGQRWPGRACDAVVPV